jgi:hypothetical protein
VSCDLRVGDTVVALKRVANRNGDVREPGETARVTHVWHGKGLSFISVEWGATQCRPEAGRMCDCESSAWAKVYSAEFEDECLRRAELASR